MFQLQDFSCYNWINVHDGVGKLKFSFLFFQVKLLFSSKFPRYFDSYFNCEFSNIKYYVWDKIIMIIIQVKLSESFNQFNMGEAI